MCITLMCVVTVTICPDRVQQERNILQEVESYYRLYTKSVVISIDGPKQKQQSTKCVSSSNKYFLYYTTFRRMTQFISLQVGVSQIYRLCFSKHMPEDSSLLGCDALCLLKL
jgi:hypothetical protein